MKKTFLILPSLLLMLLALSAKAEDYGTGIGLRFGGLSGGLSVKGFTDTRNALEGIASFGRHSFILTGLYEVHFPVNEANGLSIYAGGGGHMGFFGHRGTYLIYKNRGEKWYVYDEGRTVVVPGLDLIAGLEYKIQNAPLVVGVDLKPFVDFYDGLNGYYDGALNLRFVF